jgi:hypothetical protein
MRHHRCVPKSDRWANVTTRMGVAVLNWIGYYRNCLRLSIASLAIVTSVLAQGLLVRSAFAVSCSFEKNKAFDRVPVPIHRITAKFLAKPPADADAEQIRRYFIYSVIVGKYSSRQLYDSSLGRCSFGAEVDASLELSFELFSLGRNVHDECSFSKCAQWLSDVLQYSPIDARGFANAVDAIAESRRKSDSYDVKYLRLGVQRATQEAYRHIYAAGSKERILVDLSAEDFVAAKFDDFAGWFARQQAVLQNPRNDKTSSPQPPVSDPGGSAPNTANEDCGTYHDVSVQQLDIDQRGWGQRSIILINHAFESDGVSEINNPTLRAFCHPSDNDGDALDTPPWRDMAGRISCTRERLNRDRWLILFSKTEPVPTAADMAHFADGIARTIGADRCIHPELRILVANFTQQK